MDKMKIIAKLPHTGLANKLLVWSNAVVFAVKNNYPIEKIIVYPWFSIPIRRIFDSDKRIYRGAFVTNDCLQRIKHLLSVGEKEINPPFRKVNCCKNYTFIKNGPFNIKDYFHDLRKYNQVIKDNFFELIKTDVLYRINNENPYHIALHIRRGDFDDSLRTPLQYFLNLIEYFHKIIGEKIITYIFSDGSEKELKEILMKSNTHFIKSNNAVYDLILMSKAKIIVPSIRSTFSYYACFLSDAIILRHANDFCGIIKAPSYGKEFYVNTQDADMKLDANILLLIKNNLEV